MLLKEFIFILFFYPFAVQDDIKDDNV